MPDTFWNGLPAKAYLGTAIVAQSMAPYFWGKHLVGQRIKVVSVITDKKKIGGGIIYLDNRYGVGWVKTTIGRGMPNFPHAELNIEEGSFIAS